MVATPFSKRRQQVLKPRGSPDIVLHAGALAVGDAGAASTVPVWRGTVGSAGVLDRGKGTGWIAWKPDGLPEGEGAFLPCSFWLVDNYILQGRYAEARKLFARLLLRCNDVGLLAEEFDPLTKDIM